MVQLKKSSKFSGVEGPLLTIVMDGVGLSKNKDGNAVMAADTPTLDRLMRDYPHLAIKARQGECVFSRGEYPRSLPLSP